MPVINVDADNIPWPEQCCRCGSKHFEYQQHTEKVVVWTVLSITSYRTISLPIPVCARCANAHFFWYGAAIVAAVVGYVILQMSSDPNNISNFVPFFFLLAVAIGFVGTRMSAIKILGYDEKKNQLTLRVHDKKTAHVLRGTAGARQ